MSLYRGKEFRRQEKKCRVPLNPTVLLAFNKKTRTRQYEPITLHTAYCTVLAELIQELENIKRTWEGEGADDLKYCHNSYTT